MFQGFGYGRHPKSHLVLQVIYTNNSVLICVDLQSARIKDSAGRGKGGKIDLQGISRNARPTMALHCEVNARNGLDSLCLFPHVCN